MFPVILDEVFNFLSNDILVLIDSVSGRSQKEIKGMPLKLVISLSYKEFYQIIFLWESPVLLTMSTGYYPSRGMKSDRNYSSGCNK